MFSAWNALKCFISIEIKTEINMYYYKCWQHTLQECADLCRQCCRLHTGIR